MLRLFRNSSILTKLLFSYAFLVIVPSVLVIYIARTTILDLVTKDSIDQSFVLSRQSAAALEATIDPLTNMSSVLRRNYVVRQICSGAVSAEEKKSIVDEDAELMELKSTLDSDMNHVPVTSVHVYTDLAPDNIYDNPVLGDFFLPVDMIRSSYWHGILSATTKTNLYCPSFYLTNREINEYGELAYIEKLYPDAHISELSPSYLVIYFSQEKLKEILEQDASMNKGVSYIINERESIVTSSDENLVGAYYINYDTVHDIARKIEGYTTRYIMNEEVYASAYRLGESDWHMVTVMPSEPIISRGRTVIRNLMIIYFATLTFAFASAIILSNSITRRIQTVNGSMRNARRELPVALPEPVIHDEIGELVNSYNYMANEINALMEREKIAAENLRKTEIMALQAQINPHFLYNTMDMISWLAQTGKEDEVTHAVRTLSRFYKLTLSKKDIFTDLGSEADHVRLYLELQNMRYSDRISFIDDIPDELNTVKIPKLTLQPIVENSLLHGILEKDCAKGVIVLTAWTEGETAVIMVSDDGVGMDEETTELILSGNTRSNGGTNIAVANIHRRIQILYGDDYGLKYTSSPGEGTEVMIRIPMEVE